MLKYGSDKPDLRNPVIITDVTDHFVDSGFGIFAGIVAGGGVIRAIPAPGAGAGSRKFFDDMNNWARSEGFSGLGYINIKDGEPGGPIADRKSTRLNLQSLIRTSYAGFRVQNNKSQLD